MPALNYQARFAPFVESGQKRQTIRAWRKRPFKIGDRLYHYTGMRTKACRKLLEADCLKTENIVIDGNVAFIGARRLTGREAEALARADGFENAREMFVWFLDNHIMPFGGQIVYW